MQRTRGDAPYTGRTPHRESRTDTDGARHDDADRGNYQKTNGSGLTQIVSIPTRTAMDVTSENYRPGSRRVVSDSGLGRV